MQRISFLNDVRYNKDRVAVSLLLETHDTKELRIALMKEQVMKEHKAPFPISVHVVKGGISFETANESVVLKNGEMIHLEANIMHELTAIEESVVRVTLHKNAGES